MTLSPERHRQGVTVPAPCRGPELDRAKGPIQPPCLIGGHGPPMCHSSHPRKFHPTLPSDLHHLTGHNRPTYGYQTDEQDNSRNFPMTHVIGLEVPLLPSWMAPESAGLQAGIGKIMEMASAQVNAD